MNAASRRPRSLHELSARAKEGSASFDISLREFLDHFYANPRDRAAAMAERPVALDDLRDAYLGATAEYLAQRCGLPVPDWAETYGCALKRPFFAGGLESLKALLTVESPAAFRRRLLFVSKNALFRPRSPANERRHQGVH